MDKKIVFLLLIVPCILCNVIPLARIRREPKILSRSANGAVFLGGGIGTIGEFYATVNIGSQQDTLLVQVDTGSSDLLVYDTSCSSCNAKSPAFDFSSSSSSILIDCNANGLSCPTKHCLSVNGRPTCGFTDTYGDGSSVSGFVLADQFTFGPISGFTATFGAIISAIPSRNGNDFEPDGVSGIWGLAYQQLSTWRGAPVFQNMVAAASMFDGFSMCLLPNGALMSVGIDYSGNSGFSWSPIVQALYYSIQLNSVSVGGTTIMSAPTQSCIVDSGTTLILLTSASFAAFQTQLTSMCSSVNLVGICGVGSQTLFNGFCYQMTQSDLNNFPTLSFSINSIGSNFDLGGNSYLFSTTIQGNTLYCMGVGDSGSATDVLLGDAFMQNYHVVFDRANSQVGFGDISTCPTSTSSTGTGVPVSGTGYIGGNSSSTVATTHSAASQTKSMEIFTFLTLLLTALFY